MPKFSRRSKKNLATCDPRLQKIAEKAIEVVDFTVLEGHRSAARQNRLFAAGKSKVRYPNSKHNSNPSLAMDLAPYPIDWKDLDRFYFLAGVIFAVAASEGVVLRWGGDWDRDWDFHDQRFIDLPHFEIVGSAR